MRSSLDLVLLQTPGQLPVLLKSLRKRRGLTQAQVARRLGVTQARYATIEARPETVSTGQLLDVLAALGVDVLFRLRPDSKPARAKSSGEDW